MSFDPSAPGAPARHGASGNDRASANGDAPRRLLSRYPGLVAFLISRFATQFASGMQSVAVAWYLYDQTESALALGLLGLVQFLPGLGLVLVTGFVADRFDRRLILIGCSLVEMSAVLVMLAFAAAGRVPEAVIYGAMLVLAGARAFEHPAHSSLLPNLVPEAVLPRAVALSVACRQYALVLGPVAGGFGMAWSAAGVFAVSAAVFAVAAACMLTFRLAGPPRPARKIDTATLFAGFTFIRNQPIVLGAISLDLFAVILGGATALLPIIVRDVLEAGPWALGLLRSGPSIGAFVMTTVVAFRPIERRAGAKMLWSVAGFGLATIAFGLSTNLWLSLAALTVLGALDAVSVVVRQTLIQLSTPDDMRGRVSAVNSVFINSANSLGDFEAGVTAALFGAVPAIVIGGVGTIAVTWLWSRWFPQLLQVDTLGGPPAAARTAAAKPL